MKMTNQEMRFQNILIAENLDNHGDIKTLIENANKIYNYLNIKMYPSDNKYQEPR
jgi:hypothetical protein